MSTASLPVLTVEGVSKRYGGIEAVRNVTFAVERSEILGLIGANGAGKTTLIDIIGGEQDADAGSVFLRGSPLKGPPHRRARQGLARTFQFPKVSLQLTAFENVAVGLAVREMATAWKAVALPLRTMFSGRTPAVDLVAQACESVGLLDIHRPSHLLSFGELRLVEVARAVIQQPGVILLDEPFPGLEDDGVAMLIKALRSLSKAGQAVVVIDHNVAIIEQLVSRVILMARGEIAFAGSMRDCVRSAPFIEEYVGGTE